MLTLRIINSILDLLCLKFSPTSVFIILYFKSCVVQKTPPDDRNTSVRNYESVGGGEGDKHEAGKNSHNNDHENQAPVRMKEKLPSSGGSGSHSLGGNKLLESEKPILKRFYIF